MIGDVCLETVIACRIQIEMDVLQAEGSSPVDMDSGSDSSGSVKGAPTSRCPLPMDDILRWSRYSPLGFSLARCVPRKSTHHNSNQSRMQEPAIVRESVTSEKCPDLHTMHALFAHCWQCHPVLCSWNALGCLSIACS